MSDAGQRVVTMRYRTSKLRWNSSRKACQLIFSLLALAMRSLLRYDNNVCAALSGSLCRLTHAPRQDLIESTAEFNIHSFMDHVWNFDNVEPFSPTQLTSVPLAVLWFHIPTRHVFAC